MTATTTSTTNPVTAADRRPAVGRAVADTTMYRAIHRAMRHANQQLVDGIRNAPDLDPRRVRAIGRWLHGYVTELHTHHRIEDDLFFPALAERSPIFAMLSGPLGTDHHRLDEIVDGLTTLLAEWTACADPHAAADHRSAALALATELRDLLARHLDVEDNQVIPLIEEHFSAAEYDEFDRAAAKAITPKHAFFTVPWFAASVDAETAQHALASAPFILKAIYRLSRGRYARLVETAFGGAA